MALLEKEDGEAGKHGHPEVLERWILNAADLIIFNLRQW